MSVKVNISKSMVLESIERVCKALSGKSEYLTNLDQAVGDGDLGINLNRIAIALLNFCKTVNLEDIGKLLIIAGIEANKAGPSTMGTLLATALMRAGKEAEGLNVLTDEVLAAMLHAAAHGIQERGKANCGDKTILDALFPAAEAFSTALHDNLPLSQAADRMVNAAIEGRDRVTPLRSKIGRASWIGERTEGRVDPGCEALVVILKAVCGKS